jgi:ADP-ribose pyrophosphatase YjhB (NUDIX family)
MKEQAYPMDENLYQIADELRAVASAGLRFSENGYDQERYERVLKLSARLVAAVENGSYEAIYSQYKDNLAHLSPVLCVEAVVIRADKILLIQRQDDRLWAVPGGLAEVGESPARAAERELWEEAGLRGEAVQLLAVYDSRIWPMRTRMQLCTAQFLIRTNENPAIHSAIESESSSLSESLDVRFFDADHLPPLSLGHELRISMAFRLLNGELSPPYFDR